MEMMSVASEGVVSAFTTVAGNLTGAVADLAPVALGVFGTMLIWRYGKNFFKGFSK